MESFWRVSAGSKRGAITRMNVLSSEWTILGSTTAVCLTCQPACQGRNIVKIIVWRARELSWVRFSANSALWQTNVQLLSSWHGEMVVKEHRLSPKSTKHGNKPAFTATWWHLVTLLFFPGGFYQDVRRQASESVCSVSSSSSRPIWVYSEWGWQGFWWVLFGTGRVRMGSDPADRKPRISPLCPPTADDGKSPDRARQQHYGERSWPFQALSDEDSTIEMVCVSLCQGSTGSKTSWCSSYVTSLLLHYFFRSECHGPQKWTASIYYVMTIVHKFVRLIS